MKGRKRGNDNARWYETPRNDSRLVPCDHLSSRVSSIKNGDADNGEPSHHSIQFILLHLYLIAAVYQAAWELFIDVCR